MLLNGMLAIFDLINTIYLAVQSSMYLIFLDFYTECDDFFSALSYTLYIFSVLLYLFYKHYLITTFIAYCKRRCEAEYTHNDKSHLNTIRK